MKKKAKAKPKAKRLSQEEAVAKLKSPRPITVSSSEIKTPLKIRPREMFPAPPILAKLRLEIIKGVCKTYEENTGAKANQTRLNDFVRWCEDNSGLL